MAILGKRVDPDLQEEAGLLLQKGVGLPGGSDSRDSAGNAGDTGSILGSGRSPGEGNSNLFQ